MLTKGNFTRAEWNHLLRSFNIMNFSMIPWSHFKPFSFNYRAQERRTVEIKASKFGIKKPERKTIPFVGFGCFAQPGGIKDWVGTLCSRALRHRCGTESENPTVCSQEWHRDDNPFSSAGRPVREMSERSSAGIPVRGIQKSNLRGRSWPTTILKCPTIYNLRRVLTNV